MRPSQFIAPQRRSEASAAVLFPGGLGDFLCFAPALFALRRRVGRVLLVARPEWMGLLAPTAFHLFSIDARMVAELFGGARLESSRGAFAAAEAVYSFTGHGDEEFEHRLRSLAPGRVEVFPFRAFRRGEHASDYYARCLGVEPGPIELCLSAESRAWAASVMAPLNGPILAVHGGSGAPRKNWTGFAKVARHWKATGGTVVEIVGPAEEGRRAVDEPDLVVEQPLPRVGAILERVSAYVGNDSGITHLAAALGVCGVAVFGDSDLAHWRPPSACLWPIQAKRACEVCRPKLCEHRVPLSEVLGALLRAAKSGAEPGESG